MQRSWLPGTGISVEQSSARFGPAHAPRRQGREFGVEVLGDGEVYGCDIFYLCAVLVDHVPEQVRRGVEDGIARVLVRGRCAADAPDAHR